MPHGTLIAISWTNDPDESCGRLCPTRFLNNTSLVPMHTNALLDFSGLPRFDTVTPADVHPAVGALLTQARALVEQLTDDAVEASWETFAAPLSDCFEKLTRAWGIVCHLHAVNDIPEWREAYNRMLPEVSGFNAEIGQDLRLFAKYKALRNSSE